MESVEKNSKNGRRRFQRLTRSSVGTISANGEEEIGKMIAEAMERVGNEGAITVEEAKSPDTELDG